MPPPREVPVSPELVLVDRPLAGSAEVVRPREPQPQQPRVILHDLRATVLRMCELSDVNPPKRARRHRLLAFSSVATLWLEVAVIACGHAMGLS